MGLTELTTRLTLKNTSNAKHFQASTRVKNDRPVILTGPYIATRTGLFWWARDRPVNFYLCTGLEMLRISIKIINLSYHYCIVSWKFKVPTPSQKQSWENIWRRNILHNITKNSFSILLIDWENNVLGTLVHKWVKVTEHWKQIGSDSLQTSLDCRSLLTPGWTLTGFIQG